MAQLSVQTIRESGFISRDSKHVPYGDAVTWFQRFLVVAEVKHDAALWYEPLLRLKTLLRTRLLKEQTDLCRDIRANFSALACYRLLSLLCKYFQLLPYSFSWVAKY